MLKPIKKQDGTILKPNPELARFTDAELSVEGQVRRVNHYYAVDTEELKSQIKKLEESLASEFIEIS